MPRFSPTPSRSPRLVASDMAVGAVLQQQIEGVWHPISYFSKKLRPAETRYSTFNCELLAIFLAIKHFRHFVEGRDFHVATDHKPLTFALAKASDKYTPRQIRHLDYVAQFTTDIRHVAGLNNPVADALSRNAVCALHSNQPPTQLICRYWQTHRQTIQRSVLCSIPRRLPSVSRPCRFQHLHPPSSATQAQEHPGHSFRLHSAAMCSTHCIPSHIQECKLLSS